MVREGLTKRVESDRVVKFQFTNVGKLPPPVLQFSDVTFGYSKDKVLYRNVDLGADLDSRVAIVSGCGVGFGVGWGAGACRLGLAVGGLLAGCWERDAGVLSHMRRCHATSRISVTTVCLTPPFSSSPPSPPPPLQVGPNGAGKSTLLKLMTGQLDPLDGMVKRHNHLRIGQYHQHLTELLPEDLTPLEYMLKEFGQDQGEEKMRSAIGRFGITGTQQVGDGGGGGSGAAGWVLSSWWGGCIRSCSCTKTASWSHPSPPWPNRPPLCSSPPSLPLPPLPADAANEEAVRRAQVPRRVCLAEPPHPPHAAAG